MRSLIVAALLVVASPVQAGGEDLEVGELRDRMQVLTDGKGHYIVYAVTERPGYTDPYIKVFYGTQKASYRLEGDDALLAYKKRKFEFTDTRLLGKAGALDLGSPEPTLSCQDRTVKLKALDTAAAQKWLAKAKFKDVLWDRFAMSLARDENLVYYLVDRTRDDAAKDFRVYIGKRGVARRVRLLDLADDAAGLVLVTPTGVLRITSGPRVNGVPGPRVQTWTPRKRGATAIPLTDVPIGGGSGKLIYAELGAYTGVRFGTPCDDL